MSTDTRGLIERYVEWLKQRSTEKELEGGWKALTLPYLDRHNDHLQIFVGEAHGGLRITDEGRTLQDLKQVGCDLRGRSRRRALAEKILKSSGLGPELIDDGEIATTAVNGDFPRKLHGALMSMLALDGLANVSPPNVSTIFEEDVAGWLRSIGAKFEREVQFVGRSGATHEFDFQFPGSQDRPARVLHTIAHPDKMHIQSFTYEVIDTREAMNGQSPEFYVLLNDLATFNKKQYLTLHANKINPMKWTNRVEHAKKFAALP